VKHSGERGFGTIFFVAISIITILIIIVGARKFGGLGQSARDTSYSVEIGRRASLLAESSVEEVVGRALLEDVRLGKIAGDKSIYRAIRQFNRDKTLDSVISPVNGGRAFAAMSQLDATLTYELFSEQADLDLVDENPAVYYGIQEQKAFPDCHPKANESIGTIAFVHGATAEGSGMFKNVDRAVEFEKEFKVILTAPPWPLTPYGLFIRNQPPTRPLLPGGVLVLPELLKTHEILKVAFDRAVSIAPDTLGSIQFPSFPASDSNAPLFVRGLDADSSVLEPNKMFQRLAEVPGVSQLVYDDDIERLLIPRLNAFYEFLKVNSLFDDGQKETFFRDDPYAPLSMAAWASKATHTVDDISGLVAATLHPDKQGVMLLYGVYYVRGNLILDHNWEGNGVIFVEGKGVAPADPSVLIRRMRNDRIAGSGPAGTRSRLVIISRSDIDIRPAGEGNIQADLLAPEGTVIGLEEGVKVDGSVVVNYLIGPPSKWVEIDINPDKDVVSFTPWAPGIVALPGTSLELLQVFLADGFVTKQYWARREIDR